MRFVARRSLALLSAFAALALVSCVNGPEPVASKLAPEDHFSSLEKEGLKRAWPQELGQFAANRALKDIYSAGQFVVIEAEGGEIYCLDATKGTWKGSTVLRDSLHIPPTAIGDKLAFVVNNDVVIYDVPADEKGRPHVVDFPLTAQPLLYRDSLFLGGGDGKIACMPLAGGKAEWLVSLWGPIFEQPVISGGRLLATSASGVLFWQIDIKGEIGRWAPNESVRLSSSVAAVGDRVYVGDNRGQLYCLPADAGEPTWQRMMGGPIKGKITVSGTDLLLLTTAPSLICLDGAGAREEHWRSDGVVELLTVGRAAVYVRKEGGALAALSRETGEELWCDPLPADCKVAGDENTPTIYIADPQGSIVAITELD
jgi:outer membrane protein assembly factor BamB